MASHNGASGSRAKTDLPASHDWRTSDDDEIRRRWVRAREEQPEIRNLDRQHPVFSNFEVRSRNSGMTYGVELRDVVKRQFSCTCVDFRANGLGTCKHVEAVLLHLEARQPRAFAQALTQGSDRIDVVPDAASGRIRVVRGLAALPTRLRKVFDSEGRLIQEDEQPVIETLRAASLPALRISQDLEPWLEARRYAEESRALRREYEQKVQAGEWPAQETLVPLYPYQREGMLHLAFTERALLADEMGLGKTIQAIAACALLHRLGKARRVMVVTPASLKAEWEEQIGRFTPLPYQIVFGGRATRLRHYENAPFFTIANYEQIVRDAMDVNARMRPDVVILDEAQRIKNWNTKTAQTVKKLQSRYAFVLTGTPIENKIDELHSLMDFLKPSVLGPLFRFNRDFYVFDERGRPCGYRKLEQLHARIRPYMLRRRKSDVETELPDRTDRNHFVVLTAEQKSRYSEHEHFVAQLATIAKRRPLRREEQEKLMRELQMMRMTCDTNYILDRDDRACPKLDELQKILEECRENPDVKAVVFSEWERMLELARGVCERVGLGSVWHTGSVPQRRRRTEINTFKNDPACRVFLSTDSGGTGLNLQNASVVINCDLPWSPARLEQRIGRVWRKHQSRPVSVINLVAENTIEHRMLGTLDSKQALADGVLDLRGDFSRIKFGGGREAFLERLERLVTAPGVKRAQPEEPDLSDDASLVFARRAAALLAGDLVRCEERYPREGTGPVLVVVVERDAAQWRPKLDRLLADVSKQGASLEVVDRATDEALRRFTEAGLVASAARAARVLMPIDASAVRRAQGKDLSEAERANAARHKEAALRKLRMAQVLIESGFEEEARPAVSDAILEAAKSFTTARRLPEPGQLDDAMTGPTAQCWGSALLGIWRFVNDEHALVQPAIQTITDALARFHATA